MKIKYIVLFLFTSLLSVTQAQNKVKAFTIIPLGVKGGLDEANLSAYLVSAKGNKDFICLDAGTINYGLQKAIINKSVQSSSAEKAQQDYIKAYFISHAHLDHTSGLILNSPNDNAKNIYGFESVLSILKNNYFTWKSWANFGNEGDKPILNKYKYNLLIPQQEVNINQTDLQVTPYLLSHVDPYESSAFLVNNKGQYLLYLGDTGADSIEKSNQLAKLWKTVAPLIQKGVLHGLMIEVSFSNEVPEKALFGHLTPSLLMSELSKLNTLSSNQLHNTPILITHIKPCANCEIQIKKEITKANSLGLTIIYPVQGQKIEL